MRTVQVTLPEPVLRQAQELAALEGISLEQLVSLAVTQNIATWTAERHLTDENRSSSRKRFLEMLQTALESEDAGLRLPPGA